MQSASAAGIGLGADRVATSPDGPPNNGIERTTALIPRAYLESGPRDPAAQSLQRSRLPLIPKRISSREGAG